MITVYILFGIFWLACGIFCLYHMDFGMDLNNGLSGLIIMIGIILVIFVIGPFFIRTVIHHHYPPK